MTTRNCFLIGALTVGLSAALAEVSRADLMVTVTGPSGSAVQSNAPSTPGGGSVAAPVNFSGVTATIVGASDLQSSSLSQLFTAGLEVMNTSSSTETITINTTDGTFTAPSGSPLSVKSTLAVSSLSTPADSATNVATLVSGANTTSNSPVTVNGPSGTVVGSASAPNSGTFSLQNSTTLTLAPGQRQHSVCQRRLYRLCLSQPDFVPCWEWAGCWDWAWSGRAARRPHCKAERAISVV